MILVFTEYHGPEISKTGKTIPPKARAGSEWYMFGRQLDPTMVQNRLNHPAECTVEVSQNGRWTNHILTSVTFIEAAGPESPTTQTSTPIPTSQPVPKSKPADSQIQPVKEGRWTAYRDDDIQKLIVRQSCLKAAVELSDGDYTLEKVFTMAARMVDWVFEEEAYGLKENNEGGGDSPHGDEVTPPSPVTPAAKALDAARRTMKDRRADYKPEDAVCPNCGTKEDLKQGRNGWFCKKTEGANGCGYPPVGERLESLISYGEWRERQAAGSVPWK